MNDRTQMDDDDMISVEDGRVSLHLREILASMGFATDDTEQADDDVVVVSRSFEGRVSVETPLSHAHDENDLLDLVHSIAHGVNLVGTCEVRVRWVDQRLTFISLTSH